MTKFVLKPIRINQGKKFKKISLAVIGSKIWLLEKCEKFDFAPSPENIPNTSKLRYQQILINTVYRTKIHLVKKINFTYCLNWEYFLIFCVIKRVVSRNKWLTFAITTHLIMVKIFFFGCVYPAQKFIIKPCPVLLIWLIRHCHRKGHQFIDMYRQCIGSYTCFFFCKNDSVGRTQ